MILNITALGHLPHSLAISRSKRSSGGSIVTTILEIAEHLRQKLRIASKEDGFCVIHFGAACVPMCDITAQAESCNGTCVLSVPGLMAINAKK